jgi:hypothetical protein
MVKDTGLEHAVMNVKHAAARDLYNPHVHHHPDPRFGSSSREELTGRPRNMQRSIES